MVDFPVKADGFGRNVSAEATTPDRPIDEATFRERILEQHDRNHSPDSIAGDLGAPPAQVHATIADWTYRCVDDEIGQIRASFHAVDDGEVAAATTRPRLAAVADQMTDHMMSGRITADQAQVLGVGLMDLHRMVAEAEPAVPPGTPTTPSLPRMARHRASVRAARLGVEARQAGSPIDQDQIKMIAEAHRMGDPDTVAHLTRIARRSQRDGLVRADPFVLGEARRRVAEGENELPVATAADILHPADVEVLKNPHARASQDQRARAAEEIDEAVGYAPVTREQAVSIADSAAIGSEDEVADMVAHAAVRNANMGWMTREQAIAGLGVTGEARIAAVRTAGQVEDGERLRAVFDGMDRMIGSRGIDRSDVMGLLRGAGVTNPDHARLALGAAARTSVDVGRMTAERALEAFDGMDPETRMELMQEAEASR